MVSATVWTLLLLAGLASCTPAKRPDWLPEHWEKPEWWPENWEKPEWWPENWEKPEWWPENLEKPDWWPENWEKPEWWPENWEKPEWWPENWEKPEWWPENWEKPEWWPIGPDGEFIKPEWWPEEWETPDWWPINPDGEWEKPEWWPELERPTYVPRERGVIADITEFPGIVQVEVGRGRLWVQGCAGNILTSLHVLTAARCFSGPLFTPTHRRIRAGTSTRNNGGDVVEVERVANHPSFGIDHFDGDISVVRLRRALVYGPGIQQTPIIAQGIALGGGLPVTHAGWGITSEGSLRPSENLYQIGLVTTSRDACAERYRNTPLPIPISDNMICAAQAGSEGRDADVRDVGAPLYYDNILVGIVSSGFVLGNASFPVVSTAVSSYTDWIVAAAV